MMKIKKLSSRSGRWARSLRSLSGARSGRVRLWSLWSKLGRCLVLCVLKRVLCRLCLIVVDFFITVALRLSSTAFASSASRCERVSRMRCLCLFWLLCFVCVFWLSVLLLFRLYLFLFCNCELLVVKIFVSSSFRFRRVLDKGISDVSYWMWLWVIVLWYMLVCWDLCFDVWLFVCLMYEYFVCVYWCMFKCVLCVLLMLCEWCLKSKSIIVNVWCLCVWWWWVRWWWVLEWG